MATTATSELFIWSGTDKNGRQTKGEINAASQAMARAQLRQRGITPRSVRRKPKPLFGARKKPIKASDIAVFTRQLATMMKAGVPLVQSFDIVTDGLENPS
jgi:type IV pilus assembly protein PilC